MTDPHRAVLLARRLVDPVMAFSRRDAAGGIVLLACTAIALGWANSPWAATYRDLWSGTLKHAIDDGLMALFFLVVGLEIKREILHGHLASIGRAALPVGAALGGMVVPATIYALFNASTPGAAGWGIPMATDIAFALGVLALLGERAPASLRVFLAALAIADDIGAVLVIAFFYTTGIAWGALAAASALVIVLLALNRFGVRRPIVYALVGVALWGAVLASGVHATIAGVLVALTIPISAEDDASTEALDRVTHALERAVTFVILPVFALANAGVAITGGAATAAATSSVTLGVLLGLLLGKPLGITLFTLGITRLGVAPLPAGLTTRRIVGVSILGGIGFTMALFVAELAFRGAPGLLDTAKVGVLAASMLAGVVGWLVLRRA